MKLNKLALLQIEGANAVDRRCDLLPVCAHVLHRRSAHRAGNARKALQTCTIALQSPLDKLIPILAGGYAKQSSSSVTAPVVRSPAKQREEPILESRCPPPANCCRHPAQTEERLCPAPNWRNPQYLTPNGASTNQRAGPPIPSVVNGASGLFSSRRIDARLH